MTTKYLITGVILINPEGTYYQNADLFLLNDTTFIANANQYPQEVTARETADGVKWIRLKNHDSYFERRNVYVFSVRDCETSFAAMDHMNKVGGFV